MDEEDVIEILQETDMNVSSLQSEIDAIRLRLKEHLAKLDDRLEDG